MKVLVVQHGIFPGFVSPIPKECAKQLWKLGADVEVVTIGSRSVESANENLDFPVHCIEPSNLIGVYRILRNLVKDCDVVHYYPGKGLELMPLLNRRAKYIFNHITVSVSGSAVRDRLIDFAKRLQTAFADHVIFTDAALAKTLRPIRPVPVSLMPVGFPADLFYPCPPHESGREKILLYQGAVRPQRRLENLIQVLAQLPEEYTLTIVGGGTPGDEAYRVQLEQFAKQLGCADRLRLPGAIPQTDLRAEIEKAFLCLSYVPVVSWFQDQAVLKTLEYLACQRPVLATATRFTTEFSNSIGPGRMLITEDTVADMVNKIVNADDYVRGFYSPENLSSLPAKLAPFSWEYIVRNYLLPIYESLIGSKRVQKLVESNKMGPQLD